MTNFVLGGRVCVGKKVKATTVYTFLRHVICVSRDNQTRELARWLGITWAAIEKLKKLFKSTLPICLKRKVFNLLN